MLWVKGIRSIIVFPPLPRMSFRIILPTSHSQVCDKKSNPQGFVQTGQPFCFLSLIQMKNLFFLQDHEQSDRKSVVLAGYVSREQRFDRKGYSSALPSPVHMVFQCTPSMPHPVQSLGSQRLMSNIFNQQRKNFRSVRPLKGSASQKFTDLICS